MEKFTVDKFSAAMESTHNIRNVSVISHVDHGKSTLIDSILTDIGMVERAEDRTQHKTTLTSTGTSLYYEMPAEFSTDYSGQQEGKSFLINLIDSPGHAEFSAEVTAALRITDGTLIVVDSIEGVRVQTEAVLRQALSESIKPVLTINKLDRFFLELQHCGEDAYQACQRIIENINVVMAMYQTGYLSDIQVYPDEGTAVFSAGLDGWGFNLTEFARMYHSKFGVDEHKMRERLWGENYFDCMTRKWTKKHTGTSTCKRGFVRFCYEPIRQVINACMDNKREGLLVILEKLNIILKPNELELSGRDVMKSVMQNWLPASKAILEMIVCHLPSPADAQVYRVNRIYRGPLDDIYANGIRNCDPQGPLMLHISKFVPVSDKDRYFAIGRVFSGKISTGMTVKIMSPTYEPGDEKDLGLTYIKGSAIWIGKKLWRVEDVRVGNIVALIGVDELVTKDVTLTNVDSADAWPIIAMKFLTAPIVQVAVQCKVASDHPKLGAGLKWLNKSDCVVSIRVEETGEFIISSTGDFHLSVILERLQKFMGGVEVVTSTPTVSFRETVTAKSCMSLLRKFPTKHNQLYLEAQPLHYGVIKAIEDGRIRSTTESKTRSAILCDEFGWDLDSAKKIWCFGPEEVGPNVVVDVSKGVQWPKEIKSSIVKMFQSVSKEGALAGENMRGVHFEICGTHRGNWLSTQPSKNSFHFAQLAARSRLLEPIYLVEIQAPGNALDHIHRILNRRRGSVFEVITMMGTPLYHIRSYLPVVELFGFSEELRSHSSGLVFPVSTFHHWEIINSDPMEPGSQAAKIITEIRRRKGMKGQISSLSECDEHL